MKNSFERLASTYAFRPEWSAKKMIFLAGPRQVGKTFLTKRELKHRGCPELYYNFDLPEVADEFRRNPTFFESQARNIGLQRPTLAFDEIHKRSKWKNELKGIYDRGIDSFNIIVTGSARLDLLRTTGESLAGRYFLFRIFPMGLQELTGKMNTEVPFGTFSELVEKLMASPCYSSELNDLLLLGGFPDPLSQGKQDYRRKWAMDYRRLILREDLRDLSRIMDIDRVETLWSLLPDRVGSPLSVRSLQEDLKASHEAVSTWLLNLEKLYSIFPLTPYSKKITRAVKKERKFYLVDWALIADEAKQFENFVISSFFRSAAVWTDMGLGEFDVQYVRNALSQEADFLLLRDGKPWILGDVKLSQTSIDKHVYQMSEQLGKIPVIQIVKKTGVFEVKSPNSLVISADRVLGLFP